MTMPPTIEFFADSIVRRGAKEEEKTKAPVSQELLGIRATVSLPCALRLVQQCVDRDFGHTIRVVFSTLNLGMNFPP
jgi:hypothetical protein